jgi:hypothetical protein
MPLKLPRTIRLDPSDTFVFEPAAEPGEWAVTGSFLFWEADVSALTGKARAAFRAGFVGVDSLGFSTLVVVSEASDDDRRAAVAALARHLHERFGAPGLPEAEAAAEEELAFAASLCDHPPNTLLALHRSVEDGEVRERFRTLKPRDPSLVSADRLHRTARAFEFIETDETVEEVDLVGLTEGRR